MRNILLAIAALSPSVLLAQNSGGIEDSFFKFNLSVILSGVLLILIVAISMYWNKRFSVLERQINSSKTETGKQYEPTSKKVEEDIIRLQKDVRVITNKLQPAQSQPVPPQSVKPVPAEVPVIPVPIIEEAAPVIELKVPEKPKHELFYMATPNDDGSFDVSSRSDTFRATQSLYQFAVDPRDNTRASFKFYSDEAGIRDAVNYPHTYISPVCEPQNALNQNARAIETVRLGLAERRNDTWVVTIKTQIKYQ